MNQRENDFIDELCSEDFDPGRAISKLTGHEVREIDLPEGLQIHLDEQREGEVDNELMQKDERN